MSLVLKRASLCLLLTLAFVSCKKKKTIDQGEADKATITKYISDNGLTNVNSTPSGLYYIITTPGTGAQPNVNSFVTVTYKGYLTNNTVFDQSPATGYSTSLSSTIQGWQQGIPLFKKGGKGKLLIPSGLAYGATAQTNIPANSVLIFDIELVDVK